VLNTSHPELALNVSGQIEMNVAAASLRKVLLAFGATGKERGFELRADLVSRG
jgi:hypothetical protein